MKKKLPAIVVAILVIASYLLFNPGADSSAVTSTTTTVTRTESGSADSGETDSQETDSGNSDSGTTDTESTDANSTDSGSDTSDITAEEETLPEDGTYTSRDEVALYIHLYSHLPSNYITKSEAEALGWKDSGTLDKVAPGMSIGGNKFGNREGLLPKGHTYYECDIDYVKGNRNAKRIIYSDDGLIYYTEDHYETFTLLYGKE